MSLFQKNFSKKTTALILVVCLVGLTAGPILLLPRKAQAQCSVNVVADPTLTGQVTLQTAWRALVKTYENASLAEMIITAAELVWANAQKIIEWCLGVALNLMLHQLLAMLTNDIVNWIEDGTTPRFLTEGIGDYLKDAADNAAGNFIDQYLGAGWLCEPFDLDIKIALLDVPTFETEAKCSISDIVDNIDDFYDDFSKGGWKGWIELSKPQNNFYGAYLLAQDKKAEVMEAAEKEVETDAEAGRGFLSIKDCKWYDANGILVKEQTNVRGTPKLPEECKLTVGAESTITPPCYSKCQTKTPAAVVNELANETVTDFQKTIRLQIAAATAKAGPYKVYVTAIANSLVNRTIKEGFLLLTGEPENHISIPSSGDLGAAGDLPEIINPENVMQNTNDAELLLRYLKSLQEELDELLKEQRDNLAIIYSIVSYYNRKVIPALDDVIELCKDAGWARDEKRKIQNEILPYYEQERRDLESDIQNTLNWIEYVITAESSTQSYLYKAAIWMAEYEKAGGVETPELLVAKEGMDQAETQAIKDVQKVAEEMNQITFLDNFSDLSWEIYDAIEIVIYMAVDLIQIRGMIDWPLSDTLYAELEAAYDLEEEAKEYLSTCERRIIY